MQWKPPAAGAEIVMTLRPASVPKTNRNSVISRTYKTHIATGELIRAFGSDLTVGVDLAPGRLKNQAHDLDPFAPAAALRPVRRRLCK